MIIKEILATLKIDIEKREIYISNNSLEICISLPFNPFPDNQEADSTGIDFTVESAKMVFSSSDDDDYSKEMIRLLKIIKAQVNSKKVVDSQSFLSLLEKHIDTFYKEY